MTAKIYQYLKPGYIKFHLEFVFLAVAIGLISAFFAKACEIGFKIFIHIEQLLGLWIIGYVPLVLLIIVFLLKKFLPEAEGSGIPQALAVGHEIPEKNLDKIFCFRLIFSKIFLVFLGTLGGATTGREGPTIHIGATLMNVLGKKHSLIRRKTLLLVGAASGLASAFNTPMGGVVFAFEELLNHSKIKFSLLKIAAIAISGIVSISIMGNYSYFGRVKRELLFYNDKIFIAAVITGIIAGIFSAIFARFVRILMIDDNFLVKWRKENPYKNAIVCGIIVAVVGILSAGLSFGNGYYESIRALSGQITLPPSYAFYKTISSLFSTSSGIPGGYFATSLAIGNGIGSFIHGILAVGNIQQYSLLGMVAFLAALTRAPATSITMVLQISASQVFGLPLIVAGLTATFVANYYGKGIYEYQVQKYLKPLS